MKNISKLRALHSQVLLSWMILLGMLAFPVFLLLGKVFPARAALWRHLLLACAVLVTVSLARYLFVIFRSKLEDADQIAARPQRLPE